MKKKPKRQTEDRERGLDLVLVMLVSGMADALVNQCAGVSSDDPRGRLKALARLFRELAGYYAKLAAGERLTLGENPTIGVILLAATDAIIEELAVKWDVDRGLMHRTLAENCKLKADLGDAFMPPAPASVPAARPGRRARCRRRRGAGRP
jgi:hypothetical protein